MGLKPKRRELKEPSVFVNQTTGQWVCEWQEYAEDGSLKQRRESYRQKLIKAGKAGTLAEQRKAAEARKKEILAERRREANLTKAERNQRHLSPRELKEAKVAFTMLDDLPPRYRKLADAVQAYKAQLRLPMDTPPLEEAIELFLESYREAERRGTRKHNTVVALSQPLNRFRKQLLADRPNLKLGEVSAERIIAYLESLNGSLETIAKHREALVTFFRRMSDPTDRYRQLNHNPMDEVTQYFRQPHLSQTDAEKKKIRLPEILQLDESRRALELAYQERKHGMLGFCVLAMLVGLRPSEIYDLRQQTALWERFIRLDEGVLRIEGFGKQSDQRTIILPKVAVEWLTMIREKNWPICYDHDPKGRNIRYSNFRAMTILPAGEGEAYVRIRRKIDQQRPVSPEERAFIEDRRSKLVGSSVDVFRHTFGTNLYYQSGYDENYVVGQMGNSIRIFAKHYRGTLRHPTDAEKFFQLTPAVVMNASSGA